MEPEVPQAEVSKALESVSETDLLMLKGRLDDELQGLFISHIAVSDLVANQESDGDKRDIQELQQSIQELEAKLLEESHAASIHEVLLKKIQMGTTQCDLVYTEDDSDVVPSFIQRSLEHVELASQLKRIQEETVKLQEQLDNLKLSNLKLNEDNLQLMEKLKQGNVGSVPAEVKQNEDYKRLKGELEGRCMSLDIHRNLLLLLITGMGKDWNQHPKLSEVVQECVEPLRL